MKNRLAHTTQRAAIVHSPDLRKRLVVVVADVVLVVMVDSVVTLLVLVDIGVVEAGAVDWVTMKNTK